MLGDTVTLIVEAVNLSRCQVSFTYDFHIVGEGWKGVLRRKEHTPLGTAREYGVEGMGGHRRAGCLQRR